MVKRSSNDVRDWLASRKRSKSLSAKVQTLERKVAARKPETKHQSSTASSTMTTGSLFYLECSYIPQGNDVGERNGNQVKLLYTEYSASVFSSTSAAYGVDIYLVTLRDNAVPVIGDFIGTPGGFPNRDQYIKWKQHLTNADDNNGNILASHRWRFPMKVHYDGITATSGIRNRTFLVIKNSTGNSVNIALNQRTWFTDA